MAAEPLWVNPRFEVKDIDPRSVQRNWRGTLNTYRITDLIGDDGATYTEEDWSAFYCSMRGTDDDGNNPSVAACDRRKVEAKLLMKSVPPDLIQAAAREDPIKEGNIVTMARPNTELIYAKASKHEGAMIFEELWLDASGRAHLTGRLKTIVNRVVERAALWGKHTDIGAAKNAARISGAMRETYPNDRGWEINTKKDEFKPVALHELTIKYITKLITDRTSTPPKAGGKWNAKLNIDINWDKMVWASVGTTFTNMTHEKAWYSLAHRGLNVKNHHPKLSPQERKCRMCHGPPESMDHIVTCREARPLWLRTTALLQKMGEERLDDTTPKALLTTVVTCLDNQLEKTSDTTRATLKIAFRQHYAGIVRTETNDEKYDWKQTYLNTLQSVRTVATARGERTALRVSRSHYTSRTTLLSKGEVKKTAPLLTFDEDDPGRYTIHPAVSEETDRIQAEIQSQRQLATQNRVRPPPTPHNG